MDQPRLRVDFNELLERDLVLLSQSDTKADSAGNLVHLQEGLVVHVYQEDTDENGKPDNLIADGVVERHPGSGWGSAAKW